MQMVAAPLLMAPDKTGQLADSFTFCTAIRTNSSNAADRYGGYCRELVLDGQYGGIDAYECVLAVSYGIDVQRCYIAAVQVPDRRRIVELKFDGFGIDRGLIRLSPLLIVASVVEPEPVRPVVGASS